MIVIAVRLREIKRIACEEGMITLRESGLARFVRHHDRERDQQGDFR